MLHFEGRLPLTFEKFLLICQELIPEKDFQILETITLSPEQNEGQPIIKQWREFDTSLRNELVRLRAARKRIDSARYLRADGYSGPSLYHIALAAQRNPSPLEAEKLLDRERWNFLEELAFGHYFDLSFLIIYAYKLLILERWEMVAQADKNSLAQ